MMTSRDIVNAIAKKMIGTTYKDGYFIDVGNNIVCLTPTRVNMNTWNGYLKGDLTKELINISFLEGMNKEVPQVFLSENGTELFKVHEYCYITPSIEDKDILPIVKSIAQIKDGIYQDTTTKKVIDSGIIPSFPPLELVLFNKDNNKVVSGIYRNVSAANNAMRKMHNPNVEIRYRMLTNLKDELGNRNEFYMPLDTILPYITESNTHKNMKKNVIKLNENTLRQIVAESVKKVLKEYELSDREKDIMRGYWSDIENRRMPKQKYEPVNPQSWKKSTPNNQTPKHYQYDNQYSQMKESAGGIDLMFDRQSELDDKPEATPKGYIIVNDDGAGFTRSGIYGTPAWTGQLDARQFGGVTVYKSLAAAKRVAKKIGGTVREY